MANIHRLRAKLAEILEQQKEERTKFNPKMYEKQERYMKDRLSGMTYSAIARKYGVSRQAVSKSCAKYRNRVGLEKEGAEDGK